MSDRRLSAEFGLVPVGDWAKNGKGLVAVWNRAAEAFTPTDFAGGIPDFDSRWFDCKPVVDAAQQACDLLDQTWVEMSRDGILFEQVITSGFPGGVIVDRGKNKGDTLIENRLYQGGVLHQYLVSGFDGLGVPVRQFLSTVTNIEEAYATNTVPVSLRQPRVAGVCEFYRLHSGGRTYWGEVDHDGEHKRLRIYLAEVDYLSRSPDERDLLPAVTFFGDEASEEMRVLARFRRQVAERVLVEGYLGYPDWEKRSFYAENEMYSGYEKLVGSASHKSVSLTRDFQNGQGMTVEAILADMPVEDNQVEDLMALLGLAHATKTVEVGRDMVRLIAHGDGDGLVDYTIIFDGRAYKAGPVIVDDQFMALGNDFFASREKGPNGMRLVVTVQRSSGLIVSLGSINGLAPF